jgi:hypothetical protein
VVDTLCLVSRLHLCYGFASLIPQLYSNGFDPPFHDNEYLIVRLEVIGSGWSELTSLINENYFALCRGVIGSSVSSAGGGVGHGNSGRDGIRNFELQEKSYPAMLLSYVTNHKCFMQLNDL